MVVLENQNIKENKDIYQKEEKRIRKVLGDNILINHVGSTALPDMIGKNIIDILIGVKNEKEMDEFTNKLKELGFFPGKKSKGYIYRFLASREEETKAGDIHIHLANISSDRYKDFLILKEYLLNNKEERDNYANIKKDILNKGIDMREEYKNIKSKYVTDLLKRAKENQDKE